MMNLIHLSFQAFLLHAVGLLGRGANAYDDSDGKWGDLFQMTVIPIHATMLPDGKVLTYGADTKAKQGGGSYYEIWDVDANNHVAGANHVRLAHNTGVNIFCSAVTLDPLSGNVIIMGGDDDGNNGVKDALEFNTKTYAVRNHPKGDMKYERWYGTSINMPDGRIFIAGGESDKNREASSIPEVWSPQSGFKALPGADIPALRNTKQRNWWYPHVYVNSQGRIIIIMADGGNRDVYLVGNIDGQGSIEKVGTRPFISNKLGASIHYDVDLVVMLDNDGVLWSVDISNPTNPVFTRRLDIGPARTNAAMSLLPDGRVIITGGCTHWSEQGNTVDCAVRNVQIWDPKQNRVYTGPNQQLPRLYHSSGLILPDGSVFSAGGGAPGPLKNHNGQVYYPGYMFAASRPQITAWPENIKAGDSFVIKVKSSAIVKKVTATKPGSMTHARNCDARWINLRFDVMDGTSITVHTPGRNILIPGLWNLNVLDGDDVPSPSRLFGVNMAALPGGGSGGGGGSGSGSGVVPPPPPSASPMSTTKAPSPTFTVGGGSGSPQQNLGTYAMLKENERLYANELVKSAMPGFELRLETSGLLALYRSSAPGKIIWRAALESTGIAGRAQVQGDGHFILRATDGRPLWRTKKTGDQGKYFLTVLPEGTDPKIAVVRGTPDQPGSILWSEPIDLQGSPAAPVPVPGPSPTPGSPLPASGGGSGTEPKTIRLQTPVKACSGVPGGCGQCEGHCRDNSDCASGLVCYPKARGEPVPFCDGIDNSRTKWCTYPNSGGSSGSPPPPPTPASPSTVVKTKIPLQTPVRECRPGNKCGQCEGHCRSNSDCASGLVCYKKASGQAVPWCDKIDYSRTAWCTYA